MIKQKVVKALKRHAGHDYIEIVVRGNSAINSALSILPRNKRLLIPEEGGWLHYRTVPHKLGLKMEEIKCDQAKIDLLDLKEKLATKQFSAFLYQNPGGYFAEQPMEEIYGLCKKAGCLVILDVSGAIGTKLCDGDYADLIVGSFGRWKLVNAEVGGFVSARDEKLWNKIKKNVEVLDEEKDLKTINEKINNLQKRISFLLEKRKKIVNDLKRFNIVKKNDLGFVLIVKYNDNSEKEKVIKYCQNNSLEHAECPRYIRLNSKAISIEVKRL